MSQAPDRIARLHKLLTQAFDPTELEVIDDSHKHIGHAGARGGAGHYTVNLVSAHFSGKPLLERHRMVYDALRDMLHLEIHALSIKARSPEEQLSS